jgi:hypothetical protein
VSDKRDFGYSVNWPGKGDEDYVVPVSPDSYEVTLPHQCGNWVVADGCTKKEVVDRLSDFISQATEARRQVLLTPEVKCRHNHGPFKPIPVKSLTPEERKKRLDAMTPLARVGFEMDYELVMGKKFNESDLLA